MYTNLKQMLSSMATQRGSVTSDVLGVGLLTHQTQSFPYLPQWLHPLLPRIRDELEDQFPSKVSD